MESFENEIQEQEEKLYVLWSDMAQKVGLPSVSGKIAAVLFLSQKPLSMAEIKLKLGYSLSTISTTLKVLEGFRIVQKRTLPGSKKMYFYMKKDFLELVKDILVVGYEIEVMPSLNTLPDISQGLEHLLEKMKNQGADPTNIEEIDGKLKSIKTLLRMYTLMDHFFKKLNINELNLDNIKME